MTTAPIKAWPPWNLAQTEAAVQIYSFWCNYAAPAVAIGFVANVAREDSFIIDVVGDDDTAFGPGQIHWEPRGRSIFESTGIDIRDPKTTLLNHLNAMHWEMTDPKSAEAARGDWTKITATKTPTDAARAICQFYERAGAANALQRSAEYAVAWAKYFGAAA